SVPKRVMERSRELEVEDPAEAMAVFRGAGLVLAMRLHALFLAALAGSPVAALSYDPKVAAVAHSLGCPLQDLEAPAAPNLSDQWLQQLDQAPPAAPVTALRQQTAVHGRVLENLIRNQP
ncbi:MAG: polysaccharide pyruvyl transferase family protein, partial [Cyanobium sp.]